LRQITEDDPCPDCSGAIELTKGIEVGHIFKLGDSYSKAMNATFQDNNGTDRFFIMGCYGIGVSRTVAAAIEQNHDGNGIIFPLPLAPFQVIILNLDPKNDTISGAAEDLYNALQEDGIEVLLDDRDERPGIKFKDADLLGIPLRVNVGARGLKEQCFELQERRAGERVMLPIEGAAQKVAEQVRTALAAE